MGAAGLTLSASSVPQAIVPQTMSFSRRQSYNESVDITVGIFFAKDPSLF